MIARMPKYESEDSDIDTSEENQLKNLSDGNSERLIGYIKKE